MKCKKVLNYFSGKKLKTLEKLYFDLVLIIILSCVSFLILVIKFFSYEDVLIYIRDNFFHRINSFV